MKHRIVVIAALLGTLVFPTASTNALGRDADGSRMQARPLTPGSSENDRLSPPNDAVDWRYFRLSSSADVTITVETTPGTLSVDVTLTDAMGKSISRGKTAGGTYTSRRRMDPGLYYLAISAARPVAYRVGIR